MWTLFFGLTLVSIQTTLSWEIENAIPHEREGSFAPVAPPVYRTTSPKSSTPNSTTQSPTTPSVKQSTAYDRPKQSPQNDFNDKSKCKLSLSLL